MPITLLLRKQPQPQQQSHGPPTIKRHKQKTSNLRCYWWIIWLLLVGLVIGTATLNIVILKQNSNNNNSTATTATISSSSFAMLKSSQDDLLQKKKKKKKTIIIIAKTIAFNDVNDTVVDIMSMMTQQHSCSYPQDEHNNNKKKNGYCFQIEWKLFCYDYSPYEALLQRYSADQWKTLFQTEIVFWKGKNKVNFWFEYLNPSNITSNYIWMMDGDIQIRYMNWDCFWTNVELFQPSIFAPAVLSSWNIPSEERKFYVGSTHPQHCYKSRRRNDFEDLIAMDVFVIETQLPIFTIEAWEVVYNVLTQNIKGWGKFQSMWSPDLVWCKLIDDQLFHITDTIQERMEGRPRTDWNQSKTTCSIDDNVKYYLLSDNDNDDDDNQEDNNNNKKKNKYQYYMDPISKRELPHACMIFHETPVLHLDTKTIDAYQDEKKNKHKQNKYWKTGYKDSMRYKKKLPHYWTNITESRQYLYRAYYYNNNNIASSSATRIRRKPCQACKHEGCMNLENKF